MASLKKNSLIIPVTFIRTAGECEYSNEFLLKIKKHSKIVEGK